MTCLVKAHSFPHTFIKFRVYCNNYGFLHADRVLAILYFSNLATPAMWNYYVNVDIFTCFVVNITDRVDVFIFIYTREKEKLTIFPFKKWNQSYNSYAHLLAMLYESVNVSLIWNHATNILPMSPCQLPEVHRHQCSSLAVSEDRRFLLTAGHNAVKVWDYSMQLDVNSQVGLVGAAADRSLVKMCGC